MLLCSGEESNLHAIKSLKNVCVIHTWMWTRMIFRSTVAFRMLTIEKMMVSEEAIGK